MPWFVPAVQPIELFFFQRIFLRLIEKRGEKHRKTALSSNEGSDDEEAEVPLVDFQKTIVRLFKVMRDPRSIDISKYDVNENGNVGWYEFCSLWKQEQIQVNLTVAERTFLTFEDGDRSILGKIMSVLVFLTILVSTGSFIISTLPEMQTTCPGRWELDFDKKCLPKPKPFFNDIDLVCVIFFTLEYGIRVLLSAFVRGELLDRDKLQLLEWMVGDEKVEPPTPFRRVLLYVLSWTNLVDLAAIMPWYLSAMFDNENTEENVIIRLIRLTRVIRAFRLGRRFEAVIIIVKSMNRSIRALNVLVLNLFLGMIIFGALMYFAEQGSWDPDQQAYLRVVGQSWNDVDKRWVPSKSKSPFDSIPSCFWWAIVTATTVGYGDVHTPTTPSGKAVAALSMVWAFTVLALPIGVIGNNFSQVWEDFDQEKAEEEQTRIQQNEMLQKSIALGDPLHLGRRLIIEVWHDVGSISREHDFRNEFLGEVDFLLELNPRNTVTCKTLRMPLLANREKARRAARGQLTFEYSWQPLTLPDPETVLLGALEVTVLRAENLVSIDWRGGSSSDPYFVVIAHPNSPGKDGTINAVAHRGHTVKNTINPQWDQTVTYQMCWSKNEEDDPADDLAKKSVQLTNCMRPKMMSRQSSMSPEPTSATKSHQSEQKPSACETYSPTPDVIREVIPELQEEIAEVKLVIPQLQADIRSLQKDMQLILAALRSRETSGLSSETLSS